MSLYLAVYASDTDDYCEVDGIDVGTYADWDGFRRTVAVLLEGRQSGRRFPVLNLSSDCDTEWSPDECRRLRDELATVTAELSQYRCGGYPADSWQALVAAEFGLAPANRAEWFIDADGESLLNRLDHLARLAIDHRRPICFL